MLKEWARFGFGPFGRRLCSGRGGRPSARARPGRFRPNPAQQEHARAREQEQQHDRFAGAACRRRSREIQAHHDRIVVGRAICVRCVEARDLARTLEVGVVVEDRRFVGVDVPLEHASDLTDLARRGESMIQVAPLASEKVGIGGRTHLGLNEVGVSSLLERRDRIFLRVSVSVDLEPA